MSKTPSKTKRPRLPPAAVVGPEPELTAQILQALNGDDTGMGYTVVTLTEKLKLLSEALPRVAVILSRLVESKQISVYGKGRYRRNDPSA